MTASSATLYLCNPAHEPNLKAACVRWVWVRVRVGASEQMYLACNWWKSTPQMYINYPFNTHFIRLMKRSTWEALVLPLLPMVVMSR